MYNFESSKCDKVKQLNVPLKIRTRIIPNGVVRVPYKDTITLARAFTWQKRRIVLVVRILKKPLALLLLHIIYIYIYIFKHYQVPM